MLQYGVIDLKQLNCKCTHSLDTSAINKLNDFDIFKACDLFCLNNSFYCDLLIKNVDSCHLDNTNLINNISSFFNVLTTDIVPIKYKLIKNKINSIKFVIKFQNFSSYIHYENIILPRDWIILNRTHSSKSTVAHQYISRTLVSINVNDTLCNTHSDSLALNWNDEVNDNIDINVGQDLVQDDDTDICARNNLNTINRFNAFKNNFNFCHANVQGLLCGSHYDELKSLVSRNDFVSLFAISESWLRSSNTNKSVNIDNFKVIRSDRKGKPGDRNKGGGVAIYLRKNFRHKILLNSNKDNLGVDNIEFLFIDIFTRFSKVTFGVVYRSPKCSVIDSNRFFDLICASFNDNQNIIIVGDFNINFLIDKQHTNLMNNFSNMFSLVNDECPTHYWPGKNPSQIDLIFTKNKNGIKSFFHFPSLISYHHVVCGSIDKSVENSNNKTRIVSRDYRQLDVELLSDTMHALNWNLSDISDVNIMAGVLGSNLSYLLDQFAPMKSRIIKYTPKSWFNDNIKLALDDRKLAYDNCKRFNTGNSELDADRNSIYRDKCRLVKKLIRKGKKDSFAKNYSRALTSRDKWNLIKDQGCCKDSDSSDKENLDNFGVNDFNQFFASIHHSNGFDLNNLFTNRVDGSFGFREVSQIDVLSAFNKIKSNAVGYDGIPLKFLKLVINDISDKLVFIFNFCIKNGVYPAEWNTVLIRPLNKISNPESVSDYRPISIISVIAKLFAIILNTQIVYYLESESLLHPRQSGCRSGYSCETALLCITEDIRKFIRNRKVVVYISLDIKSAFPSVPHDALIEVCRSFGFDNKAIELLCAFLSNISQRVKIGDETSDPILIVNGILQGTNVAQTLFLIYINCIIKICEFIKGFLFVDDFQAYLEADIDDLDNIINLVNSDLQRINTWITNRGLQLNISKSKCMIIGSKCNIAKINFNTISKLHIAGNELAYCKEIKNLGVIFDENLDFVPNTNMRIQKAYGVLNRINHTRHTIPNYVKRDIATALIDPILDYGSVVVHGWSAYGTNGDERRMLVADNDKIRYVYGIKRHEHISAYRIRINGLTPQERAKVHSAVLIFKHLNGKTPSYLNGLFVVNNSRTRSNGQLRPIRPRTEFDKRAFSYGAIDFWNTIPNEVVQSCSLNIFRDRIKSWIRSSRSS